MEPRLINYVDALVGTPYKTNGRSREEGIDCLGVVLDFYRTFLSKPLGDVQLENVPEDWFNLDEYTDYKKDLLAKHCSWLDQPEPFCLVLMAPLDEPEVNHLGVYLGEDKVLNTSKQTGALVSRLSLLLRAKRVRGYWRVNE